MMNYTFEKGTKLWSLSIDVRKLEENQEEFHSSGLHKVHIGSCFMVWISKYI